MFEKLKNMVSPTYEVDAWSPRKKTHSRSGESEQIVLDCLKNYEGKTVSYDDVAYDTGFTQGYVSVLIKNLMASKAVTRKGKRGSYTFVVNRAKAKRRAYNKKKSVPVKAVASKPTAELRKSSSAFPRVSDKRKQVVFEYLKKHQHEFISQAEISKSTNTSQPSVSFAVRSLEEDGLICRSIAIHGLGTQYQVMEQGLPMAKVNTQPQHAPRETVMTSDERLIRDFLAFQRERKA